MKIHIFRTLPIDFTMTNKTIVCKTRLLLPNKLWMHWRKMPSWRHLSKRSEIHRPDQPSTQNAVAIVAVDEETYAKRGIDTPTTRWTIIPPKHAVKGSAPKTETTSGLAITAGFNADCIHYKCTKEQPNRINTGTASRATAGDGD
jgi:hypothetical protein